MITHRQNTAKIRSSHDFIKFSDRCPFPGMIARNITICWATGGIAHGWIGAEVA
jgi:hypothetical protein